MRRHQLGEFPAAGAVLYYHWQTNGTKPWHKEQVAGRGTTYSAPSVIDNSVGTIIAAEGPHHSLRFYWQYFGHVGWHAEVVAGRDRRASCRERVCAIV